VMIGDGSGVPTMLGVGSNCTVLTACSGEPTGVKWAAGGGGASAADQTEQEAGSDTSVFTSPGTQHHHRSAAKVWVQWEQIGCHSFSANPHNYCSATDGGAAGDTDHLWATDLSVSTGGFAGMSQPCNYISSNYLATTGATTITSTHGGVNTDKCRNWLIVMGDH
jgi:hypothetical protein